MNSQDSNTPANTSHPLAVASAVLGIAVIGFLLYDFTKVSLFGVECYASRTFYREIIVFGVPSKDPFCLMTGPYFAAWGIGIALAAAPLLLKLFRR
ncbi:hypothetical protein [Pannonibacter sp.]|uniref:hypothetical protein n=1 Tax=Pannonibacter sp. TaxID=1906786 RepID=UPI003F7172A8